ncbi:MAG: hypothetical protein ACFFAK_13035 [Promethearchaeota archaeon]
MVKDALKFFHAYINEMIDLGGKDLPKSVSTALGAKLANIYKSKGITDLETALYQIYKVLASKVSIKMIGENTYDIILKHKKRFCPIGGKKSPNQAKTIQESICVPYTRSFLATLLPNYMFESEIKECILEENSNRHCHYVLKAKPRNS